MGNELSKAAARRSKDWRYANRWFVGMGLDVGCGYDVMPVQNQVTLVHGYDHILGNKDAQTLPEIPDERYDFVVSSHCLEHMYTPFEAVTNWLRVLKPKGFLTVTIPEWHLYEHRQWPSRFNGDHKWAWSMEKPHLHTPKNVIYLPDFLMDLKVDIEMMQLLTEHFDWDAPISHDQTGSPAECALEFVVRKI